MALPLFFVMIRSSCCSDIPTATLESFAGEIEVVKTLLQLILG